MGHSLIDIYWLKAIEYVAALSYLPLFVLFWKLVSPKERAAVQVPAPSHGWAEQFREHFQVPADLFFHPGHTWARTEADGTVTVGLDAFGRQLVGSEAAFLLPSVGDTFAQGAPAFAVRLRDKSVDLLAPVEGTVVAVNAEAVDSPASVHAAPDGQGWLLRVSSPKLAANLRNLLAGDLARRWMDDACEKLEAEMRPGQQLGYVYADGGILVDGIAPSLSPENWDAMARRFFLTEGGCHE